ncbi:hypothetical protein KIK06_24140 [Nocardiopsis sp. EMB25]|uniref:hypothetical protein n=1 Tax=Nocardiopsis sp. EMB25 TaxID=2835867 RepID=UPI002284F335|nr:hypothetical protein [Nocardiopsis sp. EMB25]MCY9786979.1 hypothetical protein [Nocardiopsis sp. EMB25]
MTVQHTTGRHRRRQRTLAGQLWALATATLAAMLTFVFVPDPPKRERTATSPVPERPRPPAPAVSAAVSEPSTSPRRVASVDEVAGYWERDDQVEELDSVPEFDPEEEWGALVRPYMPPPTQIWARVPRPRVPEGDLLAAPPQRAPDDLADLAAVVRTYLNTVG